MSSWERYARCEKCGYIDRFLTGELAYHPICFDSVCPDCGGTEWHTVIGKFKIRLFKKDEFIEVKDDQYPNQ